MFHLFSVLSPFYRSDLTALAHVFPFFPPRIALIPLRDSATVVSVALGMYLTLAGLQRDGCERLSREEEEAVGPCQAVNRLVRVLLPWTTLTLWAWLNFLWPVTTDKSLRQGGSMEKFLSFSDPLH